MKYQVLIIATDGNKIWEGKYQIVAQRDLDMAMFMLGNKLYGRQGKDMTELKTYGGEQIEQLRK